MAFELKDWLPKEWSEWRRSFNASLVTESAIKDNNNSRPTISMRKKLADEIRLYRQSIASDDTVEDTSLLDFELFCSFHLPRINIMEQTIIKA